MVDKVTHLPLLQKLVSPENEGHSDQHDHHFRPSQRIYVLQEILNSIVYSTDKSTLGHLLSKLQSYNRSSSIRFIRLLKEGIFDAAYPLHDEFIKHSELTTAESKNLSDPKESVNRQFLYDHWATWKCVFSFQPVNKIEEYFGPKVAYHFVWLGMVNIFAKDINFLITVS